jgi:hypothetical protein
MLQISDHPLFKKHDIDSAMSSLWEFYKSRFLSLFFISFAMSLILQYGSSLINFKELQSIADMGAQPDLTVLLEKLKDLLVPMLILSLVSLFFMTILHYYILHKPLDSSKNIFSSILESLKYFIPYLLILIILAFFGSFAIAAGILVVFVGVIFSIIYLMMISFFILPVMMTEGINIGNTIIRTAKLSHRNFWNNIGWSSVFLILIIVFSLILSGIIMIPFSGGLLKSIFNPEAASKILDITSNPIFIILSSAVNALTFPIIPIFGFILYFNSRAREVEVKTPSYGDENYKVRVEDLYAKPINQNKEPDKETGELKG